MIIVRVERQPRGILKCWDFLPTTKKVEILELALLNALADRYGPGCGWIYLYALQYRKKAMRTILLKERV